MARRFSSRAPARRSAVSWSWSAAINVGSTVVPANSSVLLGSLVPTINAQLTITRVRGFMMWTTDNPQSDEVQIGAWGMAVVSSDALGVGITALPTPVGDPNYPWFAYEIFGSEKHVLDGVAQSVEKQIDSKAQRILGPAEVIILVVSNVAATAGLKFWSGVRVLSRVR